MPAMDSMASVAHQNHRPQSPQGDWPSRCAALASINQDIFHGVVAQGPPVLHQVNP